ncbi:hypothetical protein ACVBEH_14465 [Roseateles sp. GG27B]
METDPELRFEDYFREGAAPTEALLWWQLERNEPLLTALRALCHGPAALVRLRIWVFMELLALPASRVSRDELNRHFHLLRDEALELVLKRLREADLLLWDASNQQYGVTPLAQQLLGLLAPLLANPAQDADLVRCWPMWPARISSARWTRRSCSICKRSCPGCTTSLPTRLPAAASSTCGGRASVSGAP